jgi:hypothetical protein
MMRENGIGRGRIRTFLNVQEILKAQVQSDAKSGALAQHRNFGAWLDACPIQLRNDIRKAVIRVITNSII